MALAEYDIYFSLVFYLVIFGPWVVGGLMFVALISWVVARRISKERKANLLRKIYSVALFISVVHVFAYVAFFYLPVKLDGFYLEYRTRIGVNNIPFAVYEPSYLPEGTIIEDFDFECWGCVVTDKRDAWAPEDLAVEMRVKPDFENSSRPWIKIYELPTPAEFPERCPDGDLDFEKSCQEFATMDGVGIFQTVSLRDYSLAEKIVSADINGTLIVLELPKRQEESWDTQPDFDTEVLKIYNSLVNLSQEELLQRYNLE